MSDYSMFSDEQLAQESDLSGGSERIAELISRYSGLVFAAARRYSSVADYEELVSDGLDALLNAISCYDGTRGSFAAFASVCISNRMKNTAEKAVRRSSKLADEGEVDLLQDTVPSPEEIVIMKENASEMSLRMREVLTPMELRCLQGVILGHSYGEIAERIGVGRKAVDNAVARARAKLRSVFPDY